MNGQEIIDLIKQSIRDYMDEYGYSIRDMTDERAMERLGAGCSSGMIRNRLLCDAGLNVPAAKLRHALDGLHQQGLLLKRSASGSGGWNAYWPTGFADELRGE